jgi:ABC-type transport system involved in multi-copper enzyme maturation permease subunit
LPLGPIFRWETAAIGRRKRTYVIRLIYGLLILACFTLPLAGTTGLSSAETLDHRELARVSLGLFGTIVVGQTVALFLLAPALFASAIAEEIERSNLVLLLATPVTSLGIVLGKLGPRLAQVVLILAVAVPVLALLSLNGGVDDKFVILSNAVLLTSAALLASMSMLISVLSAGVRQAVLCAYVAEIVWLAAPVLCDGIAAYATPATREVASTVGGFFAMTSPISVLWELATLPATMVGDFFTTMLVQLGLAGVLVATSAALLRPVAKGTGPFGWRLAPVSFLLSRRRLLPRPICGIRPVLWKEMHVARGRVVTRLFVALVVLSILVPLGQTTWTVAAPAFRELMSAGYGAGGLMAERQNLNLFLRFSLVMIYTVSAIGLAVFCGTSMTHEKEKDTWTSLVATPLEAGEIVGQKMIGAVWRLRGPGLLYGLLLALGIAAGALHPMGVILNLVQMTVFFAFTAGMATYLSLYCTSSVRALGGAFVALFFLNGGYLLGCVALRDFHIEVAFLVTPALLAFSLATYSEVDWFLRNCARVRDANEVAWLILLNLIFYGVSAVVLWFSCVRKFDNAADRPCRNRAADRAEPRRPCSAPRRVGTPLKGEHFSEIE